MAEVAGLIIGGVSLAGLFTTCVDCFEYIQLGRQYGEMYQRSMLELRVLQLRLSTWSCAVNQIQPQATARDIEIVKHILADIINLFSRAENLSGECEVGVNHDTLPSRNGAPEFGPEIQTISRLSTGLKELALRRQHRTKFIQKAKWALYKHRDFQYLIDHVTRHVESLEALFASAKDCWRQLSLENADTFRNDPAVGLLEASAQPVDPVFTAAIKEVIAGGRGHTFLGNSVTDHAMAQVGDLVGVDYAGAFIGGKHRYENNKVSGNAKVFCGNTYGGRSLFD